MDVLFSLMDSVLLFKYLKGQMQCRLQIPKQGLPENRWSSVSYTHLPKEGYKPIEINYQIKEQKKQYALVEVELLSGKSHQIRAMLAYLSHLSLIHIYIVSLALLITPVMKK